MGDLFDLIFNFLYDSVSSALDLIEGIGQRFADLLDTLFSVFKNVPVIVSRSGHIVDSYLWFIPEPARYMIYAGIFGTVLFALVKLVVSLIKK